MGNREKLGSEVEAFPTTAFIGIDFAIRLKKPTSGKVQLAGGRYPALESSLLP
jgi:hypothetical protein